MCCSSCRSRLPSMTELVGPQIEVGAIVILHCNNPKEKIWGVLCRLDLVGVAIRGLDLNSIEDWFEQERSGGNRFIGPSTQLVPMHRVECLYLDESSPTFVSYHQRFSAALEREVHELLLEQEGSQ